MDDNVETESFLDDLYDFANEEPVINTKRQTCSRCCRPVTVCWCPYLPREPIQLSTTVYILQHPFEDNQCLRTVPMLYHSLPPGKCHIIRGKRFSPEKPAISKDRASHLDQPQYSAETYFINIRKDASTAVQIKSGMISKYVIRTQPTDVCLSTLESAAVALSYLEKKPYLVETLTKPLEALCQFQLNHGAQKHQSKEYLIKNGLYRKKIKSSWLKKLNVS
eukprot:XP_014783300.1 PREDICTED: DTW domain-containing protein 2-like [Octopus bimaculoides]